MLELDELLRLQATTRDVYVDPAVSATPCSLAIATREPAAHGLARPRRRTSRSAPARAARSASSTPRARSPCVRGRRYVLPQDVHELATDVLRHRLVLTYEALAEGVQPDTIVDAVLERVPLPRIELGRGARGDAPD